MRQEQFGGAKTVEEEKILAVKEYLKLELLRLTPVALKEWGWRKLST